MDVSVLNQQSARDLTLIRWRTLHLQLGLAAATIPLIFIAPSILGRSNPVHIAGRIITPIVTIIAGAVILKSTGEIETLVPLVELIENQNLALLKNGLNSQTYVQTKTNTLYAAKTIMQLSESLEPEQTTEVQEERTAVELPSSGELQVSERTSNELPRTVELPEFTQQELEAVYYALQEGFSDSEIIKNTLGCTGSKYAGGKEKLALIKKHLEVKESWANYIYRQN